MAPTPAYRAVLSIQRQNRPSRYSVSSTMLSQRCVLGAKVKVENSSVPSLLAAATTQITGKRQ